MKIAFICSSLASGKDGVGDYARRLAGECIRQGHACQILALHDREERGLGPVMEHQMDQDTEIPCCRLSASLPWELRGREARRWVRDFNADWVSLQFVPFGFQDKGLPVSLTRQLKLFDDVPMQVMIHELWVNWREKPNLKWIVWAAMQQHLIHRLLKQLKPSVIHSHLPDYLRRLAPLGRRCRPTRLFSNIPVQKRPSPGLSCGTSFTVGMFGQFSAADEVCACLEDVAGHVKQAGGAALLSLIGGRAGSSAALVGELRRKLPAGMEVRHTGFLAEKDVSAELALCDLGLTPVPRHLVGKSGGVAAFLSHGVPVATPVVARGRSPAELGFTDEAASRGMITTASMEAIHNARRAISTGLPSLGLRQVAMDWLGDLEQTA